MAATREVVITGIGVVSPIGIGLDAMWESLSLGRSGVRRISMFERGEIPSPIGGQVLDFDAGLSVRPRKALKVMSRDILMAFVTADAAMKQAALGASGIAPERLGIVFGADMIACELPEMVNAFRGCIRNGRFDFAHWGSAAMSEMHPLWLLKYLPNMPACHIGIAHDARGPNNSLTLAEISSLSALAEASRVIARGHADAMIAGGTGCRIHPTIWVRHHAYQMSSRCDDPAAACRPFDADRDGMVHGEGAGAFILEAREHAEARGATIFARVLGHAGTFQPRCRELVPDGEAIRQAIRLSLQAAELAPKDIGHVNAHGVGTTADDRIEASAIRDTLGDVPVTAPKSYFGNLAAGTGAVELAVSLLAFQKGVIPPTLNYERPDPACPVNVVHGELRSSDRPVAMVLNQSRIGQSVAMVLAAP